MGDLYAALGVSRDADAATIRRAFRKKVRSAHPDGGGSMEAFRELRAAYDVLSDPIRRRRYDETGDSADVAPDPRRAKIIDVLFLGLDRALLKLSQTPRGKRRADIVRLVTETLSEVRREWMVQKNAFDKALEDARLLENRFVVAESENLMEMVVARRISACQTQIDLFSERIGLADEALAILRNTRFDAPLELTSDSDSSIELTEDQKAVYAFLDLAPLARFN